MKLNLFLFTFGSFVFLNDSVETYYKIRLVNTEQAHALSGTSHYADIVYFHFNRFSLTCNAHYIIIVKHVDTADNFAGFIADRVNLLAAGAAPVRRKLAEINPLAVAKTRK